jgi:hypothetical protein
MNELLDTQCDTYTLAFVSTEESSERDAWLAQQEEGACQAE